MACGKPLEAVHDRNQDILDAAVAQIVQHLGLEFGTFVGLKPQAQNVARAVRQDSQRHEDRLVRHCAVAANIDADRVHEHDRKDGSNGWFWQAVTSSITASVIAEIRLGDASTP